MIGFEKNIATVGVILLVCCTLGLQIFGRIMSLHQRGEDMFRMIQAIGFGGTLFFSALIVCICAVRGD